MADMERLHLGIDGSAGGAGTSTKQWLLILSIQKLATYARTVVCHSAYDYWPADRVHRALRAPRAFTFHSGAAASRRPAYAVMPVCMVYACMALWCTAHVCCLPNLVVCAPWQHMVCAMRGIGRRVLYVVCCTTAHMAGLRQELLDLRQRERPDEVGHVHDVAC